MHNKEIKDLSSLKTCVGILIGRERLHAFFFLNKQTKKR